MSRSYEFSPAWRKRRAKARKRQEDGWAAKSSAVTVRKVQAVEECACLGDTCARCEGIRNSSPE